MVYKLWLRYKSSLNCCCLFTKLLMLHWGTVSILSFRARMKGDLKSLRLHSIPITFSWIYSVCVCVWYPTVWMLQLLLLFLPQPLLNVISFSFGLLSPEYRVFIIAVLGFTRSTLPHLQCPVVQLAGSITKKFPKHLNFLSNLCFGNLLDMFLWQLHLQILNQRTRLDHIHGTTKFFDKNIL